MSNVLQRIERGELQFGLRYWHKREGVAKSAWVRSRGNEAELLRLAKIGAAAEKVCEQCVKFMEFPEICNGCDFIPVCRLRKEGK